MGRPGRRRARHPAGGTDEHGSGSDGRRGTPAAAGPFPGRDPPDPHRHAGRHRARRRPVPVCAGPGDLGGERRRGRSCQRHRPRARARHRGGPQDGPARLRPGRPGRGLGPATRRQACLPGDRRLRHRGHGRVDAGRPPVHARGRGGHRARGRCPGRDRVPLGRRVRAGPPARDATARGDRGRLAELHEARPERERRHRRGCGDGHRDGRGRRREPGGAARAAGVLDDAVHDQPARPRRRRRSTRGWWPPRPGSRSGT